MCPLSGVLEQELDDLFAVVRWFEQDAQAKSQFLQNGAADVRAVVTGGHIGCTTELMAALPNLGIISINGVGYDKVDLPQARARGIRVTTTPDVLTADVADLAVGLTIDLLRGITRSDRFVREGGWLEGDRPLAHRVTNRRFGIVGLGRIGRATADRLAVFGPVRYHGPSRKDAPYPFEPSLTKLAEWAEVLVITCHANATTARLINAHVLNALGPKGYLVNVARGSVLDEPELVQVLENGLIAGAALDVFADEPRVPATLIESERVVLTPHVASATIECRQSMAELVLANLRAFLAGQPLPTAVI